MTIPLDFWLIWTQKWPIYRLPFPLILRAHLYAFGIQGTCIMGKHNVNIKFWFFAPAPPLIHILFSCRNIISFLWNKERLKIYRVSPPKKRGKGHCLQRRTACKIQNGRQGAPKWSTGSGKGALPYVFGRSGQLLLNKFFDPSTPSMRKARDGKKKKWEKKINNDAHSGH